MAENRGTALELARRRAPSACEPPVEQFVSTGPMVPHGDRQDCAQSRCVEDQEERLARSKNHVVRVLILRNRLERRDWRLARTRPAKGLLESLQMPGFCLEIVHKLQSTSATLDQT